MGVVVDPKNPVGVAVDPKNPVGVASRGPWTPERTYKKDLLVQNDCK